MKRLCIGVASLAPTVLAGFPGAATAPGADPLSVVAALGAAVNAGDTDGALALFAEDAVVTLLPPASPDAKNVYTWKAEVRDWLAFLKASRFQVQEGVPQLSGDRVTSVDRIAEDGLRMLGVAPLESVKEVVVRGGRIAAFSSTLTPASVARLQAAAARA